MSILSSTSGNVPVYRFYITLTTVTYEVFPLNFLSTSIIQQRSSGHAFYRNEFNGELIFGTNSFVTNVDGEVENRRFDFDLLWDIETEESCSKLYLSITKTVYGTTETYWEGYFSTTDGEFDLDKCTFKVQPYVDDIYSDFDDKSSDKYNLPDMPTDAAPVGAGPLITTTSTAAVSYEENRLLIDVFRYIVGQLVPGVGVISSFLEDATNPVTGDTNRMNYVTIAAKYDIKNPAGPAATKAMISFDDIIEIFKCMNLRWDYDGADITVEHESYWAATPGGIDLRDYPLAVASNKYTYIKQDMPKYEKFKWMESGVQFAGWDIWYDSPCVDQNSETNEKTLDFNVTTDIELIEAGNEDIKDDGFVLLSNSFALGTYAIYNGAIPNMGVTLYDNCFFAWPFLHDYYFRHGRVILDGYMNNELNQFYTALKTKKQEVSIIYCDTFDPSEEITSELGETYFDGAKAVVDKAEISPVGVIKLDLLYGPPDNDDSGTDVFPKVVQIVEKFHYSPRYSTFYLTLSELSLVDVSVKIKMLINGNNDVACWTAEETGTVTFGSSTGSVVVDWCSFGTGRTALEYSVDMSLSPTWDYFLIEDPRSQ